MGASSCDFVGDRARGEAIEVSDKEVGQLTPTTEEGDSSRSSNGA